jgi:hypothetical protein
MCYTGYVQKNLTLTIDDDILRAARKMALDRNTSVNRLVRDYLAELVSEKDKRKAAVERLHKIFQEPGVKIGPITWTREDLHER